MVKVSTYLCYVLYALLALEISVSMYKMKHNSSHYNIKTHLNKSQTFRNVQKYVLLPFPAILLPSGITIRS